MGFAVFLCLSVAFSQVQVSSPKSKEGLRGGRFAIKGSKYDFPMQLQYQGFLVDEEDSSPIDDTVNMIFRLYESSYGGTPSWEERRDQTTSRVPVNKGFFTVTLGRYSPLSPDLFKKSMWLEIEVNGDILRPRHLLVASPYSFRSLISDSADFSYRTDTSAFAFTADTARYALASSESVAYADSSGHLRAPNALVAQDTGSVLLLVNREMDGRGLGIRIEGGDSSVALNIGGTPALGINIKTSRTGIRTLAEEAGYLIYLSRRGFVARNCRETGFVVDTASTGFRASEVDTGLNIQARLLAALLQGDVLINGDFRVNGVMYLENIEGEPGLRVRSAGTGIAVDSAGSRGISIVKSAGDAIAIDSAGGKGIYVAWAEENGIHIYQTGNVGIMIDHSQNLGLMSMGSLWGAKFMNDGAGSNYATLVLQNTVSNSPSDYIARFWSKDTLRFYFLTDGNAYADHGWNVITRGQKGEPLAYTSVLSPKEEVLDHGRAKLIEGVAYVKFSDEFREKARGREIDIVVTPLSGAGLYVENITCDGFTVRSWGGNANAGFTWMALARGEEAHSPSGLDNIKKGW